MPKLLFAARKHGLSVVSGLPHGGLYLGALRVSEADCHVKPKMSGEPPGNASDRSQVAHKKPVRRLVNRLVISTTRGLTRSLLGAQI
jgi:hypothetical protein